MPTGTEDYYAQRAAEYDEVYAKPERQEDIAAVGQLVTTMLTGRSVIDIAAGTGFWTEQYADVARCTTACDINGEVLAVARARRRWPSGVRFCRADAFALGAVDGRFDAAFVGFLWSHIKRRALDSFLAGVVERLDPGALVVVVDNNHVEGSNGEIIDADDDGNTYQRRRLADGREWVVRKNFPAPLEVATRLAEHGGSVEVRSMTYFWAATFRTPEGR